MVLRVVNSSDGTAASALAGAVRRLAAAGVETPKLDAELLLAHVLGVARTHLFAHPERRLEAEEADRFEELLRRREAREPLPYLLGEWEFLGLPFRVSPAVLIPRPETEVLVEETARRLPQNARVLDVGTGSGCVAVGISALRPDARATALDSSAQACAVALENARRLGVGDRVSVVHGAFPEGAHALGEFDAIVSNPPYIPSAEIELLAPEVRVHEPRLALDGGPDGLELIRPLVSHAPRMLVPGGLLAMEIGLGQADRVLADIRVADGWAEPQAVPDLAGVPRVILARRA